MKVFKHTALPPRPPPEPPTPEAERQALLREIAALARSIRTSNEASASALREIRNLIAALMILWLVVTLLISFR
jgi:hypothetical protein